MASFPNTEGHEMKWHEWSVHTNYSFLAGASFPDEHVKRASFLGYDSIGLCDFDGVYGLAKSFIARKRLLKGSSYCSKIRYGAEVHLERTQPLPILLRNTVILYALNHQGYEALCKLLTKLHTRGKYDGFLTLEDFSSLSKDDYQNLVCLVPMRGLLRRSETEAFFNQLSFLKEKFNENLYQLISPALHPSEDKWILDYLKCARENDIKILLSQDVFFAKPEDKIISDLQQAIRENSSLEEVSDYVFSNDERCLKSKAEIYARFKKFYFFNECMENSEHLDSKFSFCFSELSYQYPKELIPEGYSSYEWLEEKSRKEALKFYGGSVPSHVSQTIEKELSLVKQLGFADYFLTVADIVGWARKQGILCQGRGSAANSAICFVLGVTSVDPSNFEVLFERFISAERGDPPDIDVDFEHERREEVIAYIYRRYGRNRAAMVANVITFKTRGCVRSVGKALGIPSFVLDEAAKFLGRFSNRGEDLEDILDAFVKEYLSEAHELDAGVEVLKDDAVRYYWPRLSKQIKGYPRHLGIHSGGFMISHLPIERLSPIEPATMEGRTVVQWDKEDIEELGFFKIDILALGMLTAIRKTFDMLRSHYGKDLTLASVPGEDRKTYEMISRAETVGVFQIESRAQMSMLPRLRPKTFYDLVIEVAIIRPGPIQGGLIHPFLKKRDGLEKVVYPHPKLEPILKRTLGVPIFQEQVMRIAMAVGGFSAGEADDLRRKMGAWQIKGDLSGLLIKLEEGMKKEGIAPHFVAQTLKQLEAFSAYGFPESHAASFALLAYVSSYLKCHHPDAFFVSLLNSMPMGFYSAHTLIREVKKEGIEVRRICVLSSSYDHSLEENKRGSSPYAMRLGLRLVRGLSKNGAERLALERAKSLEKGSPWRSMDEFMSGRFLDRGDLVALAASDAFKVFGIDRREAIWKAHAAPLSPHLAEREKTSFFERETPKERLDGDFSAFETSLYAHPSDLIRLHYWEYGISQGKVFDSRRVKFSKDRARAKVFGLVIARQAPPTAKGMMFITIEDGSGFINLAVKPQVYEKFSDVFDKEIFLLAEGVLQKTNEVHSLMVDKVYERVGQAEIISIDESIDDRIIEEGDEYAQSMDSIFEKSVIKNKTGAQARRHPRDIPRFAIRNFH